MGTPGPKGEDLRTPSWSPDGREVVYSRFGYKHTSLLVKQWSRNKEFELYSTAWLPAYDTSGERFAVTKMVAKDKTDLFVLDEGKPEKTILTRKGLILAPSWSPDARQIVVGVGEFTAFRDFEIGNEKPVDPANGGAQVAILNADGSGFNLVTSGPNNNAFASFAPDGKHIVYRTQGPEGEGLRIMDLEDHSVKVLTSGYDNFPTWSPRADSGASRSRFRSHPDHRSEMIPITIPGKPITVPIRSRSLCGRHRKLDRMAWERSPGQKDAGQHQDNGEPLEGGGTPIACEKVVHAKAERSSPSSPRVRTRPAPDRPQLCGRSEYGS